MDTWENGAFSVGSKPLANQGLWEGEDEEDEVKDSWDQEPEEPVLEETIKTTTKKSSKKIGEKYEEKEKRRKQEADNRKKNEENDDEEEDEEEYKIGENAGDILVEKIQKPNLPEDSNLDLPNDVFGISQTSILDSKEEYEKFKDEIFKKLADANKNPCFVLFTEEVIQGLCVHLASSDLKKIHTWLGNLHIEKSKLEKGDKLKKSKGKGKARLKMEGNHNFTEYSGIAEDFDDFI